MFNVFSGVIFNRFIFFNVLMIFNFFVEIFLNNESCLVFLWIFEIFL